MQIESRKQEIKCHDSKILTIVNNEQRTGDKMSFVRTEL